MKYYLLAGEASGDLHGSNLLKAIKREDPQATCRAWGGHLMKNAGAVIVKHYRELAFMGFVEVLKNLPVILNNFKFCKSDILSFQPDVLILIDYPGFNLRMAKWAKKQGFRVFYYISPQLWAWKPGRVKTIRKYVDRLFVILPFEKDFYKKHSVEVEYFGHPLLEVVREYQPSPSFFEKNKLITEKPIVALLPGSRQQEISRMLPNMLAMAPLFPSCQFVIAGAPSIEPSFYYDFLKKNKNVFFVKNQTYDLLSHARAALVTSGTATLETALFNVPQVVCYAGNRASYQLAKILVNKELRYIGMPNLIAGKKIVEELIQNDYNTLRLKKELEYCLSERGREKMLADYAQLHKKLHPVGAPEKTGKRMVELLLNLPI